MKERSIRFDGPSVRAILAGTKTQTRQLVKPQPKEGPAGFFYWSSPRYDNGDGVHYFHTTNTAARCLMLRGCPYALGGRLWVRETFALFLRDGYTEVTPKDRHAWWPPVYRADGDSQNRRQTRFANPVVWNPSVHMPRWASRLSLEIVEVRVERLREITEQDARAEGVRSTPLPLATATGTTVWHAEDWPTPLCADTARGAFAALWDSTNDKRFPWANNPWVWAITFRRLEVPAQEKTVQT